jgi:phosphoglycerate kinase
MKDGKPTDTTRITATIPTIKHILSQKPREIVILSHLGRPDGKKNPEFTLAPLAPVLQDLIGTPVTFVSDIWTDAPASSSDAPRVLLYENVRYYPEEEGKKVSTDDIRKFCDRLTSFGDIYVNDAFGAAHRAHASIVGVKVPVRAAGLLMAKEIDAFGRVLNNPERPVLAIVGGAKVADKIALLDNLVDKVDELIIGGGMAFTFLKQFKGRAIGKSLYDEKGATIVKDLMAKADSKGVKIHLPSDYVIGDAFAENANIKVVDGDIPEGWMGLDIGPDSVRAFSEAVARAKTVVWNGPMGVFEWERFAAGSKGVLDAVRKATENGALTVVGGGDTVACVNQFGSEEDVTHVSTGGGASLELLEGKALPGIEILNDAA